VEELLAAGIDVYTTVNIQHLESLNDAVAQITGIRVRETIPDRLLDDAAEIELVDLSPEELLQRLREGKVYVPDQAEMAKRREARTAALYALSREVASATGLQEVLEAIVTQVSHILNAQVVVLLPEAGRLVLRAAQPSTITLTEGERATATWAWQHN
jgi:two-component system, OmpR family, sensor histidine kinase KdpD